MNIHMSERNYAIMQQILQSVIKTCFLTGLRSIKLVDVDTMQTYDCKVHTSERKYYVEKFIGRGWYEYAKKKGLKRRHCGIQHSPTTNTKNSC